MEPHTEEGIAPRVLEAELTIQGKRRSIKKGVIPTLRMLEVNVCLCSGRVVVAEWRKLMVMSSADWFVPGALYISHCYRKHALTR
jgi:hypothetical protein